MSDCVGCGFCCRKAPCAVAVHTHGEITECPSLVWNGEQWRCDLAEVHSQDLAIGAGCCCALNTDRRNIPGPQELALRNQLQRWRKSGLSPDALEILRAFEILLSAVGHAWIGGDAKFLIVNELAGRLGYPEEVQKTFMKMCLEVMERETNPFMKEFMGGIDRQRGSLG